MEKDKEIQGIINDLNDILRALQSEDRLGILESLTKIKEDFEKLKMVENTPPIIKLGRDIKSIKKSISTGDLSGIKGSILKMQHDLLLMQK